MAFSSGNHAQGVAAAARLAEAGARVIACDLDGERCFLTTYLDLTERKAAEDALRKSQEEFRLLVQGVTDYAIFVLDLKIVKWQEVQGSAEASKA